MPTATLAEIMDALADLIRDEITNATDVDLQIEPRAVFSPSPPTIDMYPSDPSEDAAYAGFGEFDGAFLLTVRARVSTADQDAGEDLLLAFMDDGDLSISEAILTDPLLGGIARVAPLGRTGYRDFPIPGTDNGAYLGCLWPLLITKRPS